jgi:uncharacterized membrane protein YesL
MLKIARDEEGNVTRQFFRAFRENFKKSTIVWLILLAFGIVIGLDGYVLYHLYADGVFWTLCAAVVIAVTIVYFIVLMNIFPLMARFENTVRATFVSALSLLFYIDGSGLFCDVVCHD